MIARAWPLLGVLLLVACSEGKIHPGDTVHISRQFTLEETSAIVEAINDWKIATHGAADISIVIGVDGIDSHSIVANDDLRNSAGMAADGATIRNAGSSYVTIQLNRASISRSGYDATDGLRQVAAHEMLHGFGFEPHLTTGLMRWRQPAGETPCVDLPAAEAYCAMNGCAETPISTCQIRENPVAEATGSLP